MNKEDQIFDLLEKLYIELPDTKKELKEDISNVKTELNREDWLRCPNYNAEKLYVEQGSFLYITK